MSLILHWYKKSVNLLEDIITATEIEIIIYLETHCTPEQINFVCEIHKCKNDEQNYY